ncbi:SDR family NAD(P)-dependent oxidoreductase [Candidatus Entotheonella palauensis]|uniref:SDR family NAD(P)-dependent oxidoreductase n=1 Tax=Candidatus Entotheonella palauensis TaxID=93172 RepID=UPI0015C4389F|nr:SDR family oxidoreductase [Candidatus Entotheonella palauensis]
MKKLENRVALITGAGRGIGRAIALAYAREGAKLSLAARTQSELEQTTRDAQSLGASTCIQTADVTAQAQVDVLVRHTVEQFGTIDILVNNAGIAGPIGPLHQNDVNACIQAIQVNLIGTYLCCRSVLPVMLEQNRGKIINLSGAGATSAWPDLSAYGVSKVAVVRLTETLALELEGTNIQVNALGPGSIHTQMWDELRDGAKAAGATQIYELGQQVTSGGGASMADAASLAVWLASDDAGGLNGRLMSSSRDGWSDLAARIPEIMASDVFTLRRVELSSGT